MQITDLSEIKNKDLIVFDLDGTLAPTKSTIDQEMSKLLEDLLNVKKVAVIGGGKWALFQEQLLDNLRNSDDAYEHSFPHQNSQAERRQRLFLGVTSK